jgi:hypothetical protein
MSFVGVAVAAFVGTNIYSADQARKTSNRQASALEAAREEDARKTAEAETSAQVAANARTTDTNRRRRNSALSLGDTTQTGETLGGGTVLSAGGPAPAARAPALAGAAPAGTALGAGSSAYGAGRVRLPAKPTRVGSV